MNLEYKSEKYSPWTEHTLLSIERKLENETAFDGVVKIYSLRTSSEIINQILTGKFFGDFIHCSNTGAFLRMFDNENSWPNGYLVYIDFDLATIKEIKKTNSSWTVWKGTDLGNAKHVIDISPTERIEYQIGI